MTAITIELTIVVSKTTDLSRPAKLCCFRYESGARAGSPGLGLVDVNQNKMASGRGSNVRTIATDSEFKSELVLQRAKLVVVGFFETG